MRRRRVRRARDGRGSWELGIGEGRACDRLETADRIVCSELVYQVYTGLKWPTDRTAGRWTISPDQVAKCCLPGGSLALVDLWCDGLRITEDQTTTLMRLLKHNAGAARVR